MQPRSWAATASLRRTRDDRANVDGGRPGYSSISGSGPAGVRSVVVPAAADGAPHPSEQHQDQADDEDDDAQRPEDGDLEQEPQDQQNEANDDHGVSLRSTRRICLAYARKHKLRSSTAR